MCDVRAGVFVSHSSIMHERPLRRTGLTNSFAELIPRALDNHTFGQLIEHLCQTREQTVATNAAKEAGANSLDLCNRRRETPSVL